MSLNASGINVGDVYEAIQKNAKALSDFCVNVIGKIDNGQNGSYSLIFDLLPQLKSKYSVLESSAGWGNSFKNELHSFAVSQGNASSDYLGDYELLRAATENAITAGSDTLSRDENDYVLFMTMDGDSNPSYIDVVDPAPLRQALENIVSATG